MLLVSVSVSVSGIVKRTVRARINATSENAQAGKCRKFDRRRI